MFRSTITTRIAALRADSRLLLFLTLALGGCYDHVREAASISVPQYSIGGQVSGLAADQSVVLSNNGSDAMTVAANGAITFPNRVPSNGSYSVTVTTQPTGVICTVSNGAGAGVTQDVSNVSVTCSTNTYTVSGSVSGLANGAELIIQNNGADALTISANAPFTLPTPIAYNGSYAITVATQPAGATCTVSNATGSGVTANISNVSVTCSTQTYAIGGTLTGLGPGLQLTLYNNAADPLILAANGAFTFATGVSEQSSYQVTIGTQPVGQICTVGNGQGTTPGSNVANVSVNCSADTRTIGGTVSGLASGAQVTLNNNGADPLILTSDGAFTFATPVIYNGAYSVTVGTQPTGQVCFVSNGAAANLTADVVNVDINCIDSLVSFNTPGSFTYTVPAGVTVLQITATGGGGGGSGMSGIHTGYAGGAGAVVASTLNVTAGQVLNLVVGGGGGDGADGPDLGGGYFNGAGGGGGGSSSVDAGTATQIIAGGGGGGGSSQGGSAGGSGGQNNGAGGNGEARGFWSSGGSGGDGGLGGAGGTDLMFGSGPNGNDGNGGAGGAGGYGSTPGGAGGAGTGTGTGANAFTVAGGGGGGYGGGGAGAGTSGGGAGGSVGPVGSTYTAGSNGGASTTAGGDGSIVITVVQ